MKTKQKLLYKFGEISHIWTFYLVKCGLQTSNLSYEDISSVTYNLCTLAAKFYHISNKCIKSWISFVSNPKKQFLIFVNGSTTGI